MVRRFSDSAAAARSKSSALFGELGLQLAHPLLAGVEIGQIADHPGGQFRQIVDRHGIFAPRRAQREQPFLGLLQSPRIELQRAQRRLQRHLRVGERVERRVQPVDRLVQKAGQFVALAVEALQEAGELRDRRGRAGQLLMGVVDVGGDLLRPHHHLAALGQFLLLAGDRREVGEFVDGGAQIIGLAGGRLDAGAMGAQLVLGGAPVGMGAGDERRLLLQPAILVEERAVRLRVDQRPVVVLAMDLDQRLADAAHQGDAGGTVVDEAAGPAVGGLDAAQDQIAFAEILLVEAVVEEDRPHAGAGRQVEGGRHLALLGAMAHQAAIAAPAEGERQRIEQDRLARAGLARQHGETLVEGNVEPFDENDVADRKMNEHDRDRRY